ncbi:MAG: Flp family type IVb pilin [Pseudomonadota bacterium]
MITNECAPAVIRSLMSRINAFADDESGATAIEYGLIVALIFIATVAAVRAFATNTSGMYTSIAEELPGN